MQPQRAAPAWHGPSRLVLHAPDAERREALPRYAQMFGLEPPYLELRPVRSASDRAPLTPGSIILANGTLSVISALATLTIAVTEQPWLIPCIAIRAADVALDGELMIVADLRDRLIVVRDLPPKGPSRVSRVLGAVRRRGAPSAQTLARWIARRLQLGDLEPLLVVQFRDALECVPATLSASVSTFSRIFARLGSFTARDWRALAHCCAHVAAAERERELGDVRLSRRSLAEYARKYLDLAPRELDSCVGWEWVAERALRLGGYV